MQDALLLTAVLVFFAFGWFFIKELDAFLMESQRAQEEQFKSRERVLRIGFSNPFVADCISNALEQYSKQYYDVSICLFYGNVENLLEKAALHKLDIVFLPEKIDIPSDKNYNGKKVMLMPTPVITKYGELPVEPIEKEGITLNVIWREESGSSAVKYFIKYI